MDIKSYWSDTVQVYTGGYILGGGVLDNGGHREVKHPPQVLRYYKKPKILKHNPRLISGPDYISQDHSAGIPTDKAPILHTHNDGV